MHYLNQLDLLFFSALAHHVLHLNWQKYAGCSKEISNQI